MTTTDIEPTRWRKKPVEIDARRFPICRPGTPEWEAAKALAEWCGGNLHRLAGMDGDGWTYGDPVIDIPTLEGTMSAREGDWIIQGVGHSVSLPGAGPEALDSMAVGAPDDAGVTFDLLQDGGDGLEGRDVRRLTVHVIEVEGHSVLSVAAVDAASLDLVRRDPRLQLTGAVPGLGVHALAVAGVLQAPPAPGGTLLGGGLHAGWTRPTGADRGAESGITAARSERPAALAARQINLHDLRVPDFYPCKPDIFEQTYELAEPHPVARVELFTDTTGDHRWRAIARNGEIVATSGEGYRNAAHARAMAERILPGVGVRDEETDRG